MTFPRSQGKQIYYDARKSSWGDLFPHTPKHSPVLRYTGSKAKAKATPPVKKNNARVRRNVGEDDLLLTKQADVEVEEELDRLGGLEEGSREKLRKRERKLGRGRGRGGEGALGKAGRRGEGRGGWAGVLEDLKMEGRARRRERRMERDQKQMELERT